jgi:hypothetical protein
VTAESAAIALLKSAGTNASGRKSADTAIEPRLHRRDTIELSPMRT